METQKELNAKILAITMLIQQEHPELSKFLNEMTDTIPDTNSPEINVTVLREYYDSLTSLLKKYELKHP